MILWTDCETTGLDARSDRLLELGFMITNNDLAELAEFSVVFKPEDWPTTDEGFEDYMPDVVLTMHTASGLLYEVCGGFTLQEAEAQAIEWLQQHGAQGLPVAGSTVRFDRNFIEFQMPQLHESLHYRCIDVSTLKELTRIWLPEHVIDGRGEKKHRVLDDIHDSINELRHYRHVFGDYLQASNLSTS